MLWVQKVISTVIVDLQIGNMGGVDGSRALKDNDIIGIHVRTCI